MDQKEWEQRLDRVADKTAQAVKVGVRVLEDAYEKGKETLKNETAGSGTTGPAATSGTASTGDPLAPAAATPRRGSPRLGLALVALGVVWLLHTLNILDQPVFPILLIVLGVYFVARAK